MDAAKDGLKTKDAKIFIVEDDKANIVLLESILKLCGYYNLISTSDPKMASNLCKAFEPDIVLLDLIMPEMDGYEVMEKLRELYPADGCIPVIILTSCIDRENRLKALGMGARDFITKPFDREEILLRVGNVIENSIRYKELRNDNERLARRIIDKSEKVLNLEFEIANHLVKAAEVRDNNTGSHMERIGRYASELAKAAGLPVKFCKDIENAAKMHDIGKMAIPDSILMKPGELDEVEWEIMKKHAEAGSRILAGSGLDVLRMADIIALTHHERWDGTGYPRGLSKKEIPIEGRITAICDVFDTLLSKRPYKEAWPLNKVLEEISTLSGTQFDSELVEIFFRNIDAFLSIWQETRSEEVELIKI
ncbi:MAG: response regulator [Clostridiales bacterium]|nr:response regulator [Clostridiales bacterium]